MQGNGEESPRNERSEEAKDKIIQSMLARIRELEQPPNPTVGSIPEAMDGFNMAGVKNFNFNGYANVKSATNVASAVAGGAMSGLAYKNMPKDEAFIVLIFAALQVVKS